MRKCMVKVMYGKGSFDKNVGKILEKHTYNRTNEVMTMVK